MEEVERQVRRAYRRMGFQRFAGVLGWCWFATLLVALGLITLEKFYPTGVAAWIWAAGALGLGLLMAMVWIAATRQKPLGAAIEIDRRFALKERVSSTLALSPEDRDTEAGKALVDDAIRRVGRVDVATKFGMAPGKRVLLPLLPGVAAVLVAVFVNVDNPAEAKPDAEAVQQQVKRSTQTLQKKLAERRKQAERQGLKDAEQVFKKLEEGSKDLAAGDLGRKKALVKLNDLARELQNRRKALGGTDKLKEHLNQLKNIDRGPADKFAKAVRQGDFKQAADELQKIKDQLNKSELNDQQKEELAKQLDQMQQKLRKLAAAHRDAQEELRKRAEQLRQAGQMAEAGKLEEQLAKLLEQAPQMEQLDQLADKLGQCAKCLQDGQLENAAAAVEELMAGIGDLQQQLDEMEMLEAAMDQLADARERMNCPHCNGFGCGACQGERPGMGMGRGQGRGPRPEEKDETGSYDSQVRGKLGKKGSAVVTDLVHGPNVKGQVEEEIKEQIDTARRGSTDPLTGRRIPRKHREHALEYFNRFREGE